MLVLVLVLAGACSANSHHENPNVDSHVDGARQLDTGSQVDAPFVDPSNEPFEVSFQAGARDALGNYLGGTELMNLTAHGGKLYAGIGYWMDVPGSDPTPGPQIISLASPTATWLQDAAFSESARGGLRFERVTAMREVTFTTDGAGQAVTPPVTLLLACVSATAASGDSGEVFSRDDTTGEWVATNIAGTREFRALGFHHDAVTNVDLVFAGGGNGESGDAGAITSGVYDATAPGKIRWNATPEFTSFTNKVTAFVESSGHLYFAAKPKLYQRTVDGADPVWLSVDTYSYAGVNADNNSGLRGLTNLASTDVILGTLEGVPGTIRQFTNCTALAGCSYSDEVQIDDILGAAWGAANYRPYVIAAYNDIPVVTDPNTSDPVHLIGLQAHSYVAGLEDSTWYLTRRRGPTYALHEVAPLSGANPDLRAVRAIIISPFPEDQGHAIYLGGYDCSSMAAHNTAWLYRVGIGNAL